MLKRRPNPARSRAGRWFETNVLRKKTGPRGLLGRLHKADVRIFRKIAFWNTPWLDRIFAFLSNIADKSVLWMIVSGFLAGTGGRFGRRSALRGLVSIGLTSAAANLILKPIARRVRPDFSDHPRTRRLRHLPTSTSFPSGHSASAAAFAAGVVLELPPAGAAVAPLAGGVAFSRIYNGVHYPGDVLAGIALGTAIGFSTKRFWPTAPREPAQLKPVRTPYRFEPSESGEGVAIVVNPSAGPALSTPPTDELRELLPDAKLIEVTDGGDFAEALQTAAAESKVIGVAGGDGSVNAGAAVAQAQGKPFVVIPAGTLNHLARDLGLEGARDAIDAVKKGQTVAVDVALIDGKTFLNTASFGSYVDLVDARERLESKIGKWPAVFVALFKVLRSSEPVEVEIDGRRRSIWMIFIGNCRYHPEGFTPSWRDRLDDGMLDVRIVNANHPFARSRLLFSVLTGNLAKSRVYEQLSVPRMTVKSFGGPLRLARDGETFDGSSEFVVEKQKEPLKIYVPVEESEGAAEPV